jgi:hypothetical protein
MAYQEEIDPEYARALRQKMREWGIPIDEPSDIRTFSSLLSYSGFGRFLRAKPVEVIDVTSEIKALKSRVRELERRVGGKREITKADIVYERFRKGLEETDFGKIVAIDTEREEIVGKGDTILEAYNEAKERTGKDQFDFKRVGYKYLYEV